MSKDDINSPCVRNCCLDGQDVCVGCKRTINEILEWGEAGTVRKLQILENCQRRSSAASNAIGVHN